MILGLLLVLQQILTILSSTCPIKDEFWDLEPHNVHKYVVHDSSAAALFKYINMMTANKDSYLTELEIRQHFLKFFKVPHKSATVMSEGLLRLGDQDQDNQLSLKEFIPAFKEMVKDMNGLFSHVKSVEDV